MDDLIRQYTNILLQASETAQTEDILSDFAEQVLKLAEQALDSVRLS